MRRLAGDRRTSRGWTESTDSNANHMSTTMTRSHVTSSPPTLSSSTPPPHCTAACIVVCLFSFVMFADMIADVQSIEWLSLSRVESYWNRTRDCRSLPAFLPPQQHQQQRHQSHRSSPPAVRLPKSQRRFCSRKLWMMPAVAHAARSATEVCQELFADKRWNCSSVLQAPTFTPDLTEGSREQAFVYSLSAATLVQSIARACSSGVVTGCSCGRMVLPPAPPGSDFKWDGCNDNVAVGQRFSEEFTDEPWITSGKKQQKLSKKAMTNLHNNAVGRKAAVSGMTTTCKCHGVSGSCSVKTCWKTLQDARSVGIALMNNYIFAVEVDFRRKSRRSRDRTLLPVAHTGRTNFTVDDLIFYTQSPDYCLPEASLGSVGTTDRLCEKDNPGPGGCQSMCCGRGYTSRTIEIQFRCDCKYYWCCYVKCKTCTRTVEINRCR